MAASPSNLSHQKRVFLLNKLDEVIKLWASGSGQGSFSFSVDNGTPSLKYGLQLGMLDVVVPTHRQHHRAAARGPRHRGPARVARDRQRAAKHQAAIAAKQVFPGRGQAVGSAAKPVLPIPLKKGDILPSQIVITPPSPPPVSAVASTASPVVTTTASPVVTTTTASTVVTTTTTPTSLASPMNVATSQLSPAMVEVRDELLSETDDEDDEPLTPGTLHRLSACSLCGQPFSSSSGPGYCPPCDKYYHTECGGVHDCLGATFRF